MNVLADLGIPPVNALWMLLALMFILMLYRFQTKNEHFDLADLFMTYSVRPPRADLTSVIIFMMAIMAIWVCVVRANRDEDPTNLVIGVLGIFVLRQAFKIGADAYSKTVPPAAEPEPPVTTTDVAAGRGMPVNPIAPKRGRVHQ